MNIRVTPLNIITSVLIVAISWLLLFPDEGGWRQLGVVPMAVLMLISFITDIVFRRLARDIKRIWLIEVLFIIFAVVLFMLIRA